MEIFIYLLVCVGVSGLLTMLVYGIYKLGKSLPISVLKIPKITLPKIRITFPKLRRIFKGDVFENVDWAKVKWEHEQPVIIPKQQPPRTTNNSNYKLPINSWVYVAVGAVAIGVLFWYFKKKIR